MLMLLEAQAEPAVDAYGSPTAAARADHGPKASGCKADQRNLTGKLLPNRTRKIGNRLRRHSITERPVSACLFFRNSPAPREISPGHRHQSGPASSARAGRAPGTARASAALEKRQQ
jgi:hypothetical protein